MAEFRAFHLSEHTGLRPISKEASSVMKGVAVLIMVLIHYWSNEVFQFCGVQLLYGASCVCLFAFVSGYAHAFKNTNSHGSYIGSVKRTFLPFYKLYLFVVVTSAILAWFLGRAYHTNQLLYAATCLKPNAMIDSWWYAFTFAVFCFVVNPCMGKLKPRLFRDEFVYWFVPVLVSVLCLLSPAVFSYCQLPSTFTSVWNHIPIVRTLMYVPYYLIGYMYFVLTEKPSRYGFAALIALLFVCVCWPFSIYNIEGIYLLDVGRSFLECVLIIWIFARIRCVKSFFCTLGKVSAFWWLLHMPVLMVLSDPLLALIAGVMISFIVNFIYTAASRAMEKGWQCTVQRWFVRRE